MRTLLIINASASLAHSHSRTLAQQYEAQWRRVNPDGRVLHRDLGANPPPHLDEATFAAFYTPADERSEAQRVQLTLSDSLIEELKAADDLVIAAPMYNFSIPTPLKAWFDHICRVGVTFRYGSNGPEGLLPRKHAVLLLSRGGRYEEGASMDHQAPYLRQLLNFIGIEEVEVVAAQGMAGNADAGMAEAKAKVDALFGA
ncbi:FMN-dependent NADH-azoreductase [Ferrimonas gelatinilytica]|uniref:FMN dependent NADH:quinone oxidoreductase n=1 Tax=Ferrimonas gelatinilytica TaxID=1255257 RepID=A0ABP9RVZ1_9GAMM